MEDTAVEEEEATRVVVLNPAAVAAMVAVVAEVIKVEEATVAEEATLVAADKATAEATAAVTNRVEVEEDTRYPSLLPSRADLVAHTLMLS